MTTDTPPRRAAGTARGGRGATIAAVVCLVLGLGALGWSTWDLFWRPVVDPQAAATEVAALRAAWSEPGPAGPPLVLPGEPVALVRIPRFGTEVEYLVLAGTDPATLARGLGWYNGTAAPGEPGNFAVAGLRGTAGPLAAIAGLRAGDHVLVETRAAIHTYEITNDPAGTTVGETDTWVVQPVPGRPEVRPSEALLTLTTSGDLFRSGDRTVAFGRLEASRTK